MRIELDLPDWAEGRHIYVMAGVEEVARKPPGRPWQIKTVRCDLCGGCCKKVGQNWRMGRDPETGWCARLRQAGPEFYCDLGLMRPLACCVGEPQSEFCCIRFEES